MPRSQVDMRLDDPYDYGGSINATTQIKWQGSVAQFCMQI